MTFWQFAFKNVSRNSKAYFAYFVSSAFSIMVFFSFTVYAYHPRLQNVQSFQERDPLMNLAEYSTACDCYVLVLLSLIFNWNIFKCTEATIRDTHDSRYLTETIKKTVIY